MKYTVKQWAKTEEMNVCNILGITESKKRKL